MIGNKVNFNFNNNIDKFSFVKKSITSKFKKYTALLTTRFLIRRLMLIVLFIEGERVSKKVPMLLEHYFNMNFWKSKAVLDFLKLDNNQRFILKKYFLIPVFILSIFSFISIFSNEILKQQIAQEKKPDLFHSDTILGDIKNWIKRTLFMFWCTLILLVCIIGSYLIMLMHRLLSLIWEDTYAVYINPLIETYSYWYYN